MPPPGTGEVKPEDGAVWAAVSSEEDSSDDCCAGCSAGFSAGASALGAAGLAACGAVDCFGVLLAAALPSTESFRPGWMSDGSSPTASRLSA